MKRTRLSFPLLCSAALLCSATLLCSACGDDAAPASFDATPPAPDAALAPDAPDAMLPAPDADTTPDAAPSTPDAAASTPDADTTPDATALETVCDDGLDDDGDGAVDCADYDCDRLAGCEHGFESTCDDGIDNDADLLADCTDAECDAVAGCELGLERSCGDGVDNDADGATDCDDADCTAADLCVVHCPVGSLLVALDGPAPVAIADLATAVSSVTVAGPELVALAAVGFSAVHTWDSDLRVSVVSPSGIEVVLSNQRGGGSNDFVRTLFLDTATTAIAAGAAPFTGAFRPDAPLALLDGDLAAGTWSLRVTDVGPPDVGVLTEFRLLLCVCTSCELGRACADGADNDGDGNADCDDTECASAASCQPEVDCDDGLDGDLDGAADCLDFDCAGLAGCELGVELTCDDGLDNDADGRPDCADSECATACAPSCAPGSELMVVLGAAPVAILDGATVVSSLSLLGPGVVTSARAVVNLTHTWDSDLSLALHAPSGAQVALATARGFSGDDYLGTLFGDDATTAIALGVPPFTGAFRPEQPLATLAGHPVVGTWELSVNDAFAPDDGELTVFRLYLCVCDGTDGCEFGAACGDGVDNDGDGLTDCIDSDCTSAAVCGPTSETVCDDGLDDEGDGAIDCADSECALAPRCMAGCPAGSDVTLFIGPTPLAIPDPGMVASSVSAVAPGLVTGVAVRVSAVHPSASDLDVSLQSPAGTTIILSRDNGADGNDYTDTLFVDWAAMSITAGMAPFAGSFRPEQPLTTFVGEAPTGEWQLRVTDDAATEAGALTRFELYLCTCVSCEVGALCRDGLDSDGDGQPDCADTDCATDPSCLPELDCADGLDNDFDGAEDCVDADCAVLAGCSTSLLCPPGATLRTASAAGLPLAIPDSPIVVVPVAVPVAGAGVVVDAAVHMSALHTFDGDLFIQLESPAGTRITLADNRGGAGNNFTDTFFGDAAFLPISAGVAPFVGPFRPETPFSTFDGEPPAGTWRLRIDDQFASETGTLLEVELSLCVM
ncbi:MAG: hypothetical protein EXR73_07590 [Myxococcales bacterium]|nr:hypothetical protein [Myxococcales bacterium]